MKLIRMLILGMIMTGSSMIHAGIVVSGLQKVYEKIFGSEPMSAHYDLLFRTALTEFGVKNPEQVPLRKMNKNAMKLFSNAFVSFTLTGIWINEEVLDSWSADEQTFIAYHEAAHYAFHHHLKAIFALELALPVCAAIPNIYQVAVHNRLFTLITTAITWYGGYRCFKSFIKRQEREADLAATRLLILQGRRATVSAYADSLYQLIEQGYGNGDDEWHDTLFERYENIVGCLETYKDKSLVKILPLFV